MAQKGTRSPKKGLEVPKGDQGSLKWDKSAKRHIKVDKNPYKWGKTLSKEREDNCGILVKDTQCLLQMVLCQLRGRTPATIPLFSRQKSLNNEGST